MIQLIRGFRGKLEEHLNIHQPIQVQMQVSGNGVYDTCCFGVDAQNHISDDRYTVFYNQTATPDKEITVQNKQNIDEYRILLSMLPQSVNKLLFTVSIDGTGTMGQIRSHTITILQNGNKIMELRLTGSDFRSERAIIGIEIYRKGGWRLCATASGFNGGLGDLLRSYGGEVIDSVSPAIAPAKTSQGDSSRRTESAQSSAASPSIAPDGLNYKDLGNQSYKLNLKSPAVVHSAPSVPAARQQQGRVELRKGQKVSLEKKESGGEIIINLNWSQPQKKGLFGFGSNSIDLDLECLYELEDGSAGTVQALGRHFGSYANAPYILLDGDDRSGANSNGENLRINSARIPLIRRILVYTSIYEGAANWAEAKGIVTVRCPGNPDIIVRMDEYHPSRKICAIALFEKNSRGSFTVEKRVEYFDSRPLMDKAFHWGLHWTYGRK